MNATAVFPIIPAAGKAMIAIYLIGALLVVILGLLGYVAWSTRHVTLMVSPEGLRIRGDLYGRLIPLRSLALSEAAAVDLTSQNAYRPKWRTNGVGLPGYASGWFRLKNGEKALLFVTDHRRVVRIPTTEGFVFMASVADPDALLQELRNQGSAL